MADIYEQHQTAFKNVSAYIITDKAGNLKARVAFKHGAAVTCYFHLLGLQMQKGIARGGNYDRASAAAKSAWDKIAKAPKPEHAGPEFNELRAAINGALQDDGAHWDNALTRAGFGVFQAV